MPLKISNTDNDSEDLNVDDEDDGFSPFKHRQELALRQAKKIEEARLEKIRLEKEKAALFNKETALDPKIAVAKREQEMRNKMDNPFLKLLSRFTKLSQLPTFTQSSEERSIVGRATASDNSELKSLLGQSATGTNVLRDADKESEVDPYDGSYLLFGKAPPEFARRNRRTRGDRSILSKVRPRRNRRRRVRT